MVCIFCLLKAISLLAERVLTRSKLYFRSFITFLLYLSRHVFAEHGLWEPTGSGKAADGDAVRFEKRSFTVAPRIDGIHLWKDGTIRYYYADQATEKKVHDDLQAATERWYASGLNREMFKTERVSKKVFKSDRANVLLISYNERGILSTTPGVRPLDTNDENYRGPLMLLSDRTNVGMLEVIGNYAHELGHSWGLYHEHQNPAFWGPPIRLSGLRIIFRFNCQNLIDYPKVAMMNPEDREKACTIEKFAASKNFTASEYLPHSGPSRDEDGGSHGIDWESIMLYPSGAGGIGEASPGNDQRAPVLLKADGSRLSPNLYPSTRNIAGLAHLYRINWPKAAISNPSDPSNPKHSTFMRLFKRSTKCN